MDVFANVAFGLRMRGISRADTQGRVESCLDLVHLGGMGSRAVRQLSGGQQQRVALARALVIEPSVLLLDESLSALDKKLREQMRMEIRQLQQRLGITTIFVTHDQEEALVMSDRIAVIRHGRVDQIGTPSEVYGQPVTRFVANFIGLSNFLHGWVVERRSHEAVIETSVGRFVARATGQIEGTEVDLAIRPEKIAMTVGEPNLPNRVQGHIVNVVYLGQISQYHVRLATGEVLVAAQQNGAAAAEWSVGSEATLSWHPEDTLMMAPDGNGGPHVSDDHLAKAKAATTEE